MNVPISGNSSALLKCSVLNGRELGQVFLIKNRKIVKIEIFAQIICNEQILFMLEKQLNAAQADPKYKPIRVNHKISSNTFTAENLISIKAE